MEFFKGLGKGIAWGAGVSIGYVVLMLAFGIVECFTCGCIPAMTCTGDCLDSIHPIFDEWISLLIAPIAGAIIGAIYGIVKQAQEISEEAERRRKAEAERRRKEEEAKKAADSRQRQANASEFQRRSGDVSRQCETHKSTSENIGLRPNYEATALQENLWDTVNNASLPLQKLDDIVASFKVKEGV